MSFKKEFLEEFAYSIINCQGNVCMLTDESGSDLHCRSLHGPGHDAVEGEAGDSEEQVGDLGGPVAFARHDPELRAELTRYRGGLVHHVHQDGFGLGR